MKVELGETTGNGREKNLVECPFCGQKMLNVVSLGGVAKVVVKCRRCHRFVLVRMAP